MEKENHVDLNASQPMEDTVKSAVDKSVHPNCITLQKDDGLDDLPLNNISIVEESVTKSGGEINSKDEGVAYEVGDLVWAFISGSPLWPSIITQDAANNVHTKLKGR